MEEFRICIREILASTITADKLTKKQFIELENKLVSNHHIIFDKLMNYHYANDVRTVLKERDITVDEKTIEDIVKYMENKYDSNLSIWENVDIAINTVWYIGHYEKQNGG